MRRLRLRFPAVGTTSRLLSGNSAPSAVPASGDQRFGIAAEPDSIGHYPKIACTAAGKITK
jgi:hypothetical protein